MNLLRILSFAVVFEVLFVPGMVAAYTPNTAHISGVLLNGDCVSVAEAQSWTLQDAGGTCTPNAVLVANPSGSNTGDTQSINAAVTAAGAGGVIVFPPDKLYLVGECGKGWPGSSTINPAKVDLNGSTIKLNNGFVYTTATGNVSNGATSIAVASAVRFCVGDEVMVRDVYAAGANWTYPTKITNVSGNTLTVNAVNFGSGGPTTSGTPIVERVDYALYFSGTTPIRITGGTFDCNAANRVGQTQVWGYGDCVMVPNTASRVVFDHNVVQNSLTNGFGYDNANWAVIDSNYFTNIYGMGEWSGGQGTNAFDQVVTNNVFNNVFQLTGSTTPTATQYGHMFSQGAIVSSVGPKRLVISGNVVDTSTGFCAGNPGSSTNVDYVISNNVFYHCDMGGFNVAGGTQGGTVAITGNVIASSGHETPYVTGAMEVTQVNLQGNLANVSITGNTFQDAVLDIYNPSPNVAISGNLFYDPTLTNVHHVTNQYVVAALDINGGANPATPGTLSVTGNTFSLPSGNVTDQLDAIDWNYTSHGAISGNEISGGWFGLQLTHTITDLAVTGNDFINQSSNASAWTHAAAIGDPNSGLTATNLSISNNTIGLDTPGTDSWVAIVLSNGPPTFTNSLIPDNAIYSNQTPAGTQAGLSFGSGTVAGMTVSGNQISLASGTAISAASAGNSSSFSNNMVRSGSVSYGSNIWPDRVVEGTGTLSGGSATLTLSGMNSFHTSSSFGCSGSDITTASDAVGFKPLSGTSVAVSGNANDNFFFHCAGD